jgi:nucleoside phosphorylase
MVQFVSTTICYVNRPLCATAVAKISCLVHNPGYEGLFDDQRIRFLADNALGLIPRRIAIGENIARAWLAGPDDNKRLWKPVTGIVTASSIETLRAIPQQLIDDGIAATWHAIIQYLPSATFQAEKELRRVLQHDYFSLYAREFALVVLRNLPFMQDNFGLSSQPKIYDYKWLGTCLNAVAQDWILDASAQTILLLRKQHGFIRFIDAYTGLCAHCSTVTDLRYHIDHFARTTTFPWATFSAFRIWNPLRDEYELPDQRAIELSDALGSLAARIEVEFSLAVRLQRSTAGTQSKAGATAAPVRVIMDTSLSELVIFVALEEEFEILKNRWGLKRAFRALAANGEIGGVRIEVVCAGSMGRVPAAVSIGHYLAGRRNSLPRLILAVGLAGGFPEEKIEEGMIIIPETVVDLATRKIRDKGDARTTEFRRHDFHLEKMVYDYLTSSDFDHAAWERTAIAQADWPKHRRPSFHRGLITSLDEVVSSDTWRKELLDNTPKLLGVEMEGGGLCAVAQMYKVPVSMIRAVSDNADPAKKDTTWRTRGMKTIATLIEAVEWPAIIEGLKS